MKIISYLFARKIKKIAEAVNSRLVSGKYVCVVGTMDNDAIVCVLDDIQRSVNLTELTARQTIKGALVVGVRFHWSVETNAQRIVQLLKELKEIDDRYSPIRHHQT